MRFKRGDTVVTKSCPNGPIARVVRVAKDGLWADIRVTGTITGRVESWSKRMQQNHLKLINPSLLGVVCEHG